MIKTYDINTFTDKHGCKAWARWINFCTLKHTFNNNYSRIRWRAHAICNITGVISSILWGSFINFETNLAFIVMWNSYSWVINDHSCICCYNSSVSFPAHVRHWWWSIIPADQLHIVPSSNKLYWISINCHCWYICNCNTVGIRMKYFGTPFDFPLSQEQETQQECLFLLNWPLCNYLSLNTIKHDLIYLNFIKYGNINFFFPSYLVLLLSHRWNVI